MIDRPPFFLWSTRSGGWLTHQSTYSTDISQAKAFADWEAATLIRRHQGPNPDSPHEVVFGLIPVRREDMEALGDKRKV